VKLAQRRFHHWFLTKSASNRHPIGRTADRLSWKTRDGCFSLAIPMPIGAINPDAKIALRVQQAAHGIG
jgi:hypothetical protein